MTRVSKGGDKMPYYEEWELPRIKELVELDRISGETYGKRYNECDRDEAEAVLEQKNLNDAYRMYTGW